MDVQRPPLNREQRRAAKARLVAAMEDGRSWQEAVALAGLTVSRATAYRVRRQVHLEGDSALDDGRHGHAYKFRPVIQQWLVAYCQAAPHTPGHILQAMLRDRFDILISIGHLNAVRAALGVRYQRPRRKKKG